MSFNRKIVENGLVVEKSYREAKAERVVNGTIFKASAEKHILTVISCEEANSENGFIGLNKMDFEVEKNIYDDIKPFDTVSIKYELVQNGQYSRANPLELKKANVNLLNEVLKKNIKAS